MQVQFWALLLVHTLFVQKTFGIIRMPFPMYSPRDPLGINLLQCCPNNPFFDFLRESFEPPTIFKEYDFIVVGSGPAGAVIANRLSEVKEWNILLLEAGKGEMLVTYIPLLAGFLSSTDYSWGHKMEPQENICLAMTDQICPWPRGKAIGGTSVINYMIYTRGNRREFDGMAAKGNYGWSYDDVLKYYLKSENANLVNPTIISKYHAKGGYLSVEHPKYRTVLADAFIQAGKQLGYDEIDYSGPDQFGVSIIQATTLRGSRHSAGRSFLQPIKRRSNLHILDSAYVTKVLINPNTKDAYGVEYVRNKKTYRVKARKEVILSAGAFNSPHLLMLSGIGPADHLKEVNIPVIKDLPVGQSLYDHITYTGLVFLVNQTVGITEDKVADVRTILNWFKGRGMLTSIGGAEGLGYIKTKLSNETGNYPDIELIFCGGGINSDGGSALRRWMGISDEFYNEHYGPINARDSWTMFPMLLHPKSKGYMRLRDNNPFNWPLFYGNYYTDPNGDDINTMVEAIKEIIRFSETPAMQKFGSKLYDVPFRNCKHLGFGTDDYWRCALRHISVTLHHQISTCKMGPASDPEAVVDPELRVYGINRLRVADTSIIPETLTAHTNAPSFMIGEKASDMIKKTWNRL